jgi:hypothetical protein
MKYCILFALLIILVNASAQESFVKGYVVKKSGDSIKGYVNRGSDARLSKSVQFKNQLKAEKVETFTPGDINGFGYENENKYQSITFADPLDGGKQKTEFARFLVEGKNSLYSVFSNGSYFYYLVSRMDSSYVLYNEKIRSGRSVQNGNFRNVLHYVTRDCPNLQKYAKTISFSERNLTGYINELNNCVGDKETIIHSKRIKNIAQFLLYAGGISYDKNTMYTFQGQVRLTSPGVSKRTSFVIGLTYTHLVENEYSQIAGAHTDFTTNMITLPFYFQFNFTKSKLQPIAYAGFSVAYTKLVNPDLEDPKGFLEDYGVGFVGGIGLEYYPISRLALKADWRYELRGLYPNIGLAYKIH